MSFVEGGMSLDLAIAPGALERLQKQLTNIERGVRVGVTADTKGLQAGARGIENLDQAAKRTATSIQSRLGGAAKATAVTFGVLAAAGGAGLVAIGTKAIMAGKEFNVLQQQVRASLTAILGTTAAAEGLLSKVNTLNDTSPFPRQAFLSATQQLVGFGVSAEKVVPIIDAVQEAVAGIGGGEADIQMMTRSFAQIQSQGRLTGDVLFSLGAKGIDAAAIIGKQMGKTGTQIKEEVSKGAIGAEQAIDLLSKGLKDKFGGAVENVGKSFLGAADRVKARLRDIGADLTKVFINPRGGGAAVDGLNNIAVALGNVRKIIIPQIIPAIQKMADLFVKATQVFKEFTGGIKTDQIQKFVEVLKMAAPLAALLGTNLVKSVTQNVPILGRFTGALSGPVLALGALALTVPEVRDGMTQLAMSLQPVAEQLLPSLVSLLTSAQGVLTAVAPLVVNFASAFAGVVQFLAPVVSALVSFASQSGILSGVLSVLIGRFLLLKITGATSIGALSSKMPELVAKMQMAASSVAGGLGSIRGAAASAGAGIKGLVTGISGMTIATGIIGGVSALMGVLAARTAQAKAEAQALTAAISEGRNFTVATDRINAQEEINRLIDEEKGKIEEVNSRFWNTTQSSKKDIEGHQLKIDALEKQRDRIIQIKEVQDDVLGAVAAQTGESLEDVLNRATAAGINFQTLRFDQGLPTINTLIKGFEETGVVAESALGKINGFLQQNVEELEKVRAASNGLRSAQRAQAGAQESLNDLLKVGASELKDKVTQAQLGLESAQLRAAGAADRQTQAELSLTQAQRGLTAASEGVIDAQERLADLEKERARLLADVNAEARELAEAEANLTGVRRELVDITQREQELLREKDDLADETPDKLAAGDRSIERAKIALNNARREELELQKELNKETAPALDLTGLSIDQIKTRLAGARAELAVQRSIKKVKSDEEKADDLKSAGLNRLDAEQALKDAIESRGDTEHELAVAARENAEALQGIQLDREAALRREETVVRDIGYLRQGDTTVARTLKGLNNEIEVATRGVVTANEAVVLAQIDVRNKVVDVKLAVIDARNEVINLRDRQREVETATDNIKKHSIDIKKAQEDVKLAQEATRDAGITYKEAIATAKGDNESINSLLLTRLGINSQLIAQNPKMAEALASSILSSVLASIPTTVNGWGNRITPTGVEITPVGTLNQLTSIITNRPNDLLGFLRGLGFAFAEGGIVTQHTLAQIGEHGKAEVVLPLTKPARAMTLLAQSIPLMHTSLQKKLAPALSPELTMGMGSIASGASLLPTFDTRLARRSGTSTKVAPFVGKNDGPVTYGQLEELIELLKNQKGDIRVEAPITVVSSGDDVALARKLSKKVERQVNDILSRR